MLQPGWSTPVRKLPEPASSVPPPAPSFSDRLLAWWDAHGRKDLPWQQERTPYRVWVAEVMLQQTQAEVVVPYFGRFVERFPSVGDLAAADLDEVLHLWSGLGYYARARNLHRAASVVMQEHGGTLPRSLAEIAALPGIGRSTAAAIAAQAFGARAAILDGNAKRVHARHWRVDGPAGAKATVDALWERAETCTPNRRVADYTQAIMDLGALVCVRRGPRCGECPAARHLRRPSRRRCGALPKAGSAPSRDASNGGASSSWQMRTAPAMWNVDPPTAFGAGCGRRRSARRPRPQARSWRASAAMRDWCAARASRRRSSTPSRTSTWTCGRCTFG